MNAAVSCVDDMPPVARPRTTILPTWRLRKVVRHIEGHLDRQIRLSELADLACMSPSHFTRTFKSSVNVTPQDFIRRRRIERAKTFLASSSIGLAQVAQACGFSDQAHFTRTFHELVGQPPSRWRRSLRPLRPEPFG